MEIIGEIFLEIAKGDLLFENYTPNLNGEVKLRLKKRNPEKSLVYQLLGIIKLLFFYSSFANTFFWMLNIIQSVIDDKDNVKDNVFFC